MTEGRVVVVVNGYTGVGAAVAKTLGGQGDRVVIAHPHVPEAAADVVNEIVGAGGSALELAADFRDSDEFEELVQEVLATFGRWDVLVHTCAATVVPKPFREVSADDFERDFNTNALGAYYGLQLALAHLADDGRIVAVSGGDSPLLPTLGRLVTSAAADFAERGITVNAVEPISAQAEPSAEVLAAAADAGASPEIAAVAAYLAGTGSAWTGQRVVVDDSAGKSTTAIE
ncbi:SDR family NAD(P)-dependent oxidoreductase [Nocardia panacis]|uniref:SDR family NAD(P)-dependent oxidoreductase n=1 Tax=Nocardia panacis TaxID=2340916 RepID=UPI0011C36C40|nr:SDR family oxidoreductase [Nocardia panacis]